MWINLYHPSSCFMNSQQNRIMSDRCSSCDGWHNLSTASSLQGKTKWRGRKPAALTSVSADQPLEEPLIRADPRLIPPAAETNTSVPPRRQAHSCFLQESVWTLELSTVQRGIKWNEMRSCSLKFSWPRHTAPFMSYRDLRGDDTGEQSK